MTSETEKTVHQQSITTVEQALEVAGNFGSAATVVLAAEVRRLQASLQGRYEDIGVIQTSERSAYKIAHEAVDANSGLRIEVDQLRETIRVMSTNEGKLHAKIAELETDVLRLREELVLSKPMFSRRQLEAKLARVEALPEAWRLQQRITAREADLARELATELEAALRVGFGDAD